MDRGALITPRRGLLTAAAAGAVLAAGACAKGAEQGEASAGEILARNHAAMLRILVVCREAAALIRANFSSVDGHPVGRAADLFRRFSDYQAQLEETEVFPGAMKTGGAAAGMVPTLIAQHARGRQITDYVVARTAAGAVAAADAEPLALALESLARMYEAQIAFEETVIVPAWRSGLSHDQLHDAASRFGKVEAASFKGGSAQALAEIAAIEAALRINDLGRYTADAPGQAPVGVLPAPPNLQEGGD